MFKNQNANFSVLEDDDHIQTDITYDSASLNKKLLNGRKTLNNLENLLKKHMSLSTTDLDTENAHFNERLQDAERQFKAIKDRCEDAFNIHNQHCNKDTELGEAEITRELYTMLMEQQKLIKNNIEQNCKKIRTKEKMVLSILNEIDSRLKNYK